MKRLKHLLNSHPPKAGPAIFIHAFSLGLPLPNTFSVYSCYGESVLEHVFPPPTKLFNDSLPAEEVNCLVPHFLSSGTCLILPVAIFTLYLNFPKQKITYSSMNMR